MVNPALGSAVAGRCPGWELRRPATLSRPLRRPSGRGARLPRSTAASCARGSAALQEHEETLATIMTLEQGKPLAEARREVDYGAGYVELYAEELQREYGDIILPLLRPPHPRHAPPGRRGQHHHALELPHRHDHAQGGACSGHGCTWAQSSPGGAYSALSPGHGGAGHRRGCPEASTTWSWPTRRASGRSCWRATSCASSPSRGSTNIGRKLMAMAAPTIKKLSMELAGAGGSRPSSSSTTPTYKKAVPGAIGTKLRNAGRGVHQRQSVPGPGGYP